MWVGVRNEVMWGWIEEMRVIIQRNERIRLFSWVDRSEKRKKKTHRASSACERGASSADRDWEMSGSELGASSLDVWIVLLELGVWIRASQALCACERAVSSACERAEWKMFEVKMSTELIFRLFCLILWSNWKYLPDIPNMLFSRKWFLNFIWSQNKRTLRKN